MVVEVGVISGELLYSSVHDNKEGVAKPPKASAALFCVPTPPRNPLVVINAPPEDHDVPLYSSVQDTTDPINPPKAKPSFCVPAPARKSLAVDKAPPADHDVPLYSSVHPTSK